MPPIEWSDERYGVGVGDLDAQHRTLLDLLNDAEAALHAPDPTVAVGAVLERLREYTEFHFRYEEELMSRFGYPLVAQHREEHARLTHRVKELIAENRAADRGTPLRTLRFLTDWLTGHIGHVDRELGLYVQAAGTNRE